MFKKNRVIDMSGFDLDLVEVDEAQEERDFNQYARTAFGFLKAVHEDGTYRIEHSGGIVEDFQPQFGDNPMTVWAKHAWSAITESGEDPSRLWIRVQRSVLEDGIIRWEPTDEPGPWLELRQSIIGLMVSDTVFNE